MREPVQRLPYSVLALSLLALDQASKAWAASRLDDGAPLPIVPGVFRLALVRNRGALFGLFQELEAPLRTLLFLALPIMVVAVLGWLSWNTPAAAGRSQAAFALLLGGALGNLLDRLRLGHVVDFLDFYLRGPGGEFHHWPAFNVADACICVGIALLAFDTWRSRRAPAADSDHASYSV